MDMGRGVKTAGGKHGTPTGPSYLILMSKKEERISSIPPNLAG